MWINTESLWMENIKVLQEIAFLKNNCTVNDMTNKQEHCCHNMNYYTNTNGDLVEYDSSIRQYYLLHQGEYGTNQKMQYCPWCGTKLPESLNTVWGKILKEDYGLDDPCIDDADKVPEEFKTDEWWKKRGL